MILGGNTVMSENYKGLIYKIYEVPINQQRKAGNLTEKWAEDKNRKQKV